MTIDEQRQWSSCARRLDGLKFVLRLLKTAVGENFVAGKDELARALRDQAAEVQKEVDAESKRLDGFIRKERRS